MALNQSWMLVVAVSVLLVVSGIFFYLNKRSKSRPSNMVGVANLSRLTGTETYKNYLFKYKLFLGVLTVVMVVVGLLLSVLSAKPVTVSMETPTKYNRDIVLCLDVSGSMLEVDEELIKQFQSLSDEFKGERISLVIWNSKSYMVFPLTDDYKYVQENLETVKKGIVSYGQEGLDFNKYTINENGGSLIGDGLTACTLAFDDEDTQALRSRSIILATDNIVNGEELVSLNDAAGYAKEQNITIYGIRPTTGWESSDGNEAEDMRKALEDINGGYFYEITNPLAVSDIVKKISSEEAKALESEPIIVKTDNPAGWVVGVGLGLLVLLGLCWRLKV